jgi:FkbM family methyltransferase
LENNFPAFDLHLLERVALTGFKPNTVFDAGAATGLWSLNALTVFDSARYELFEPLAGVNPAFDEGLAAARLHANIRLHPFAIGATSHVAAFHVDDWDSADVNPSGDSAAGNRAVMVNVEPLDALVASGRIDPPEIIRMDIRGGVLAALVGAQDICLPHAHLLALRLCMTRRHGGHTPLLSEVCEYLMHEDYYPYEFGVKSRDEDGMPASQDVWFVRRRSALGRLVWQSRLDRPGAAAAGRACCI